MSDTGKKRHRTLYSGDQHSSQSSWVSRLIAAPPVNAISSQLPVAALTIDKMKLSASCARTGTYIALLKISFVIGLPELTRATMPLRMLSHTAGTPTITEGEKALISPLQFRTGLDGPCMSCRRISLPTPQGSYLRR